MRIVSRLSDIYLELLVRVPKPYIENVYINTAQLANFLERILSIWLTVAKGSRRTNSCSNFSRCCSRLVLAFY
jgi:hypothetical protein